MSTEIYWLVLTTVMTGLFWVPYILDRIKLRGLAAITETGPERGGLHSEWAKRAICAHQNAIENLVIFGILILVLDSMEISNGITQTAVVVYFLTRLAHYFIYMSGIPVARTLSFAVGWAAQMAIALVILGVL